MLYGVKYTRFNLSNKHEKRCFSFGITYTRVNKCGGRKNRDEVFSLKWDEPGFKYEYVGVSGGLRLLLVILWCTVFVGIRGEMREYDNDKYNKRILYILYHVRTSTS